MKKKDKAKEAEVVATDEPTAVEKTPRGFVEVRGSRFGVINRLRTKQVQSHTELVRAAEESVSAHTGLGRAMEEYNGLASEFEVGRLKREIELINLRAERDRLREVKEAEASGDGKKVRNSKSEAQRIIDEALGDIGTLQEFDRQAEEILGNTPPEDRERVQAILEGARERFLRERGA